MSKPLPMSLGNTNRRCFLDVFVWDGLLDEYYTDLIPVPETRDIMFRVHNRTTRDIKIKFQYKVGNEWITQKSWDGTDDIYIDIDANTHHIFGPATGWPLFDGGRIHVDVIGEDKPLDEAETEIEIIEA